jgi:hypothetical protein
VTNLFDRDYEEAFRFRRWAGVRSPGCALLQAVDVKFAWCAPRSRCFAACR